MSEAFRSGMEYAARQLGTSSAMLSAEKLFASEKAKYYGEIEAQIDALVEALFSRATNLDGSADKKKLASLAGNLYEEWAAGTWRVSAAAKRIPPDAYVPRSNDFASPDVVAGGVPYGSKVYQTAEKTFQAQAKTPYQVFREKLQSFMKDHPDQKYVSEEQFYKDRGVLPENAHFSMYHGQKLLVPEDHLLQAVKLAKQNAQRNRAAGDLTEAARYQEVAKNLTDRIREKGAESIPLSREEILELARLVKDSLDAGERDAVALKNKMRELGVDVEAMAKLGLLFTPEEIIAQVLRDGMKAGVVSLLLSLAPVIIDGILQLMRSGKIDEDTFTGMGAKAAKGTGVGFLAGALTSGILLCGKTGKLGEGVLRFLELENSSSVIASGVVLCISTICSIADRANGKLSRTEFLDELVRNTVITIGSTIGGVLFTAAIPVLHGFFYMLGSFVGSVVSGFLYNVGKNLLLSICVDSGWTFFGLVEQDYRLPEDVLSELGLEFPDLDTCELDTYELDTYTLDPPDLDPYELELCEIRVLRRGFIGVDLVGYL